MSHLPLSRRAFTAGALSSLALGLAACGSDADADEQRTEAGQPRPGGRLTFAIANDPITLNPQGGGSGNDTQYVTRQLVDSLVDQSPETGEIVPWLATEWTISDDASVFTFTLRQDVSFSDGTPFTAESVKASFDDIVAQGANANVAVAYFGDYKETLVVDEYTAQVSFTAPNGPFIQALAGPALAPLAAATLAQSWEERAAGGVIGTGPFTVDHYTANTEVLLLKRPGYAWPSEVSQNDGEAYVDEVLFQVAPEASVRSGLITSGQVDVIGGVPPQDQETLEAGGAALVIRANPGTTFGLTPYTENPGVDDVNVRRAFSLALNRDEIRDATLNADYAVSRSVLSDTTPGWSDQSELLGHDPAEAARLLDDAGWTEGSDGVREKNGERLSLVLAWQTNFVANQSAVELIQQQVAQVGIEVELVSGTVPDITEGEGSGDYDFRFGNSSRADGDVLRTSFSSESGRPFTAADPELDALLEQQRAIVDPTERNALLADIQRYLLEQGRHIPTFQLTTVLGTTATTHGVWLAADSRLGSLSSAWLDA
ncbi:ABC transporter substrate-binding protein [Occultella kanbiaonis]|uniref:ABC transporter substrate-binding protein n=1 Tax=Occultella kanbiaonis TaxID=2675754 RepID=UPI0012B6AC9E|nr:ABC transporter substrate-binding protein [Occultella kanbiaonis]